MHSLARKAREGTEQRGAEKKKEEEEERERV